MILRSEKEHPVYEKEEPEIKTKKELEKAKEEAGVSPKKEK